MEWGDTGTHQRYTGGRAGTGVCERAESSHPPDHFLLQQVYNVYNVYNVYIVSNVSTMFTMFTMSTMSTMSTYNVYNL